MTTATQALQDARHELDSLGGLWVIDTTGENPHNETWQIDTTKTINKIEQALAVCERSLSERIEAAYNDAANWRGTMLEAGREYRGWEAATKLEHADEWAAAKNSEVRRVLLDQWLEEDLDYQKAREAYDDARDGYRLALLEIERLKLLVALEGATK